MSQTPRNRRAPRKTSITDLRNLSLGGERPSSSNRSTRNGVCHLFQKGKCTYGTKCKYRHEIETGDSKSPSLLPGKSASGGSSAIGSLSTPTSSKDFQREICCQFRDRGTCAYGDQCKYSHSPAASAGLNTFNAVSDTIGGTYRSWKRLLGRGLPGIDESLQPLSPTEMGKFLNDALRILEDGASEHKQKLVQDLGTEGGLTRLKQVVEAKFVSGYTLTQLSFQKHCIPLLKLVSHKELRNSLILEKAVGTIYNLIYGADGKRGVAFFGVVSQNIFAKLDESRGTGDDIGEALSAAACTFYHMISLNQSAVVQDEFKDIVGVLCACYVPEKMSEYEARMAHTELEKIKERLNMGDTIRLAGAPAAKFPAPVPQRRVVGVEFPGELSTKGKRHDNDHAQIELIKILPTHGEIRATDRTEFVPTTELSDPHHESGICRVLDTHFRLLREDTSGLLRESIQILHSNWEAIVQKEGKKKPTRDQNNSLKTCIYQGLVVERLHFDKMKGLQIDISFAQPRRVAEMKDKRERQNWWENSRQLQSGSLLALVSRNEETIFLLVADRVAVSRNQAANFVTDLASNKERALITLQLADPVSVTDQRLLISSAGKRALSSVMVEFPGLLYASFATILKGLQALHKRPNLPFLSYISGSGVAIQGGLVTVPPPRYLLRSGISLDLSGITLSKMPFRFSIRHPPSVDILKEATTLDHGQCQAFIASMTRELSMVQGPPGTGKSYLGVKMTKVLLDNRDQLKIGPIICVCYTNHALDQFLELLHAEGATKIVRLGSRSSSELLQQMTLHVLAREASRTPLERQAMWQCHTALEEMVEDMTDICEAIGDRRAWQVIKKHLEQHHHHHFQQLFGKYEAGDEEGGGWERVLEKEEKIIESWLRGYVPGMMDGVARSWKMNRGTSELTHLPAYAMSIKERHRLKAFWDREILKLREEKVREGIEEHSQAKKRLDIQKLELDRRCLQECHIIGITTTGLATQAELIRSLDAKVLICEEAGEILEAHQLTSFIPSLEHAILIGDHQQLRPHISRYELSMECPGGDRYALDKSFFERLATTEWPGQALFPKATLDVQRRMHPTISELVRRGVPYPELKDNENTHLYPDVVGMARRLFWFNHNHLENAADKDEPIQGSKVNMFEVELVMGLVRHLVRQGVYKAAEIAVLTPYLGQLRELRKRLGAVFDVVLAEKDEEELALEEDADDVAESSQSVTPIAAPSTQQLHSIAKSKLLSQVRLATVDNFQGEEAKVVVVSLVRSNKDGRCGFLKTSNRINVLLSRAQHGMYIIGNAETAIAKVRMWEEVVKILESSGNIGPELELCCPRHKSKPIMVRKAEDFLRLSPEGGCDEICSLRLNCGHTCFQKCHARHLHDSVRCMEACPRIYQPCEHACTKRCWEDCGLCNTPFYNVILPSCGHKLSRVTCAQRQNLNEVLCFVMVTKTMRGCGHDVSVQCHLDVENFSCTNACGDILPCGHACAKACSSCKKWDAETGLLQVEHGKCNVVCRRSYTTCNHSCKKPCHGTKLCDPCELPCEVRCVHSRCGKKCSEPCAPCAEECPWTCNHQNPDVDTKCHMPCAVPCDMLPCSERCEKMLPCGHQCPSLCGETCPDKRYCHVLGCGKLLQSTSIDFIDMDLKYAEVDVNEDPIIVLSCKHFFTMTSLDGIMSLDDVYELDARTGERVGPKSLPSNADAGKPKGCPHCRAPVRDIFRYNRVTKKALLDEATRKFCVNAHEAYQKLEEKVTKFEGVLQGAEKTIEELLRQNSAKPDTSRKQVLINGLGAILSKRPTLDTYLTSVNKGSQPFGIVHAMVIAAKSRGATNSFSKDDFTFQMSFYIRGRILDMKFKWSLLLFFQQLHQSSSIRSDTESFEYLEKRIKSELKRGQGSLSKLIQEARDHKFIRNELEARIYWVRFAAIELQHIPVETLEDPQTSERREAREGLRHLALKELDTCEKDIDELPERTVIGLRSELESTRRLMNGGTFYQMVSAEEKRMLAEAMKSEFRGTGHWWNCVNGHAFTIGECGMPMQQARCSECGAPIGGQGHSPVAGASRSNEMDIL